MHDERVLHAHRRAIAGIDALDLARHQSIGDIAEPRAAIGFRRHHAEKAHIAKLGHDLAVEMLLAERLLDARLKLVLRKGARRIADHALVFGELRFEIERVLPVEIADRRGSVRLPDGLAHGVSP